MCSLTVSSLSFVSLFFYLFHTNTHTFHSISKFSFETMTNEWKLMCFNEIGAVEKENKPANTNKASNTSASTKAQQPNSTGKSAKSGASNQNGQPNNNRNDRGPREG